MSATVNIAELPPDAQARVLKQISQQSVAEQQIAAAWKAYQTVEPRGLDFGKVCYEWQQKFATKSGVGNKGKGMVPILESLKIPVSTAYFWIQRFKEANGLVEVDVPNPERNDEPLAKRVEKPADSPHVKSAEPEEDVPQQGDEIAAESYVPKLEAIFGSDRVRVKPYYSNKYSYRNVVYGVVQVSFLIPRAGLDSFIAFAQKSDAKAIELPDEETLASRVGAKIVR